MPKVATGTSIIHTQMYDWDESDRQECVDFALHPANGVTAITLFLQGKGVKCSLYSVNTWVNSLRTESERIKRIRTVFDDFKGLTPDEINAYVAATMAELMVEMRDKIDKDGLDNKAIQTMTSLAKEARSSAIAMNTPHSSASMKELELGHLLNFMSKLEGIFEGDEVILERVKNACKSILVEIESQY